MGDRNEPSRQPSLDGYYDSPVSIATGELRWSIAGFEIDAGGFDVDVLVRSADDPFRYRRLRIAVPFAIAHGDEPIVAMPTISEL